MGEVVLSRFGDGMVNDSDDPEVADRDAGAFDELSRNGHIKGVSGRYEDLAV